MLLLEGFETRKALALYTFSFTISATQHYSLILGPMKASERSRFIQELTSDYFLNIFLRPMCKDPGFPRIRSLEVSSYLVHSTFMCHCGESFLLFQASRC